MYTGEGHSRVQYLAKPHSSPSRHLRLESKRHRSFWLKLLAQA